MKTRADGTARATGRYHRMPFYGDINDYCPPRRDRTARRLAACAVCLMVFGLVAVL